MLYATLVPLRLPLQHQEVMGPVYHLCIVLQVFSQWKNHSCQTGAQYRAFRMCHHPESLEVKHKSYQVDNH